MQLPQLFQRTRQPLDPEGALSEKARALPGPGTTLPFNIQPQEVNFWCWAAVASSVSRFYNPTSPWTQCAVANASLPPAGTDCCINKASPGCNRLWKLEIALARTGNFQGMKSGAASVGEVTVSIRDRHAPLGCGILWADGTGHFVVLHGFSTDFSGVPWVAVADPKYGRSEGPYQTFVSAYRNSGRWVFSYATRPA